MNGQPVAVIEGGNRFFIRTDHIGRPSFATDISGAKVWEISYLPFGEVHVSTGTPINHRFPGQWFQAEAGLHQNWMRDYDPTTGRYIEADPLGLIDGASVYGYAGGNSPNQTDRNGMQSGPMRNPNSKVGSRSGVGPLVNIFPGVDGRPEVLPGEIVPPTMAVPQPPTSTGVGSGSSGAGTSGDTRNDENLECNDECEKAKERVRQAKTSTNELGGCRRGEDISVLFTKVAAWGELCNARKQRERVCPPHPTRQDGEDRARFLACEAYGNCMRELRR